MKNEIKIVKAELDSYGGKVILGDWNLTLKCGHIKLAKTRKDCKKYPSKKIFCGQCWAGDQKKSEPCDGCHSSPVECEGAETCDRYKSKESI